MISRSAGGCAVKRRQQIARVDRKYLAGLQGRGIRRPLIAIERTNFAGDVADSEEVQHHFLAIDIDV